MMMMILPLLLEGPFIEAKKSPCSLLSLRLLPLLLEGPFIEAPPDMEAWCAAYLLEQLAATGMLPNAKCYTPIQVHVIVEALGEP